MDNKKIILPAIVIVVIVIALFFINSRENLPLDNTQTPQSVSTSSAPNSGGENLDGQASTKTLTERIWILFDKYIARAKAHDIAGVKGLSYQQSDACADPKRANECYGLMDIVVDLAKGVKKEDYVNLWSDSKQVILSTNFKKTDSADIYGYSRGYLVLTADINGDLKMLNFNPERSWFYTRYESDFGNKEVMENKLQAIIKDSDEDGLTDMQEICGGDYRDAPAECSNTDPSKRDSDADGWWDGVEFFFRKSVN